ncbi:MAG: hypothetical protein QFE16_17350 [Pseudomonadota bacterium]|nr:hypothetical protein [Pseudomonadota bacterium]
MTHPWLRKNPVMSMWLSTANGMAGSMRGAATSQVKQQVKAVLAEATNENIKRWSASLASPAAKKVTRRR